MSQQVIRLFIPALTSIVLFACTEKNKKTNSESTLLNRYISSRQTDSLLVAKRTLDTSALAFIAEKIDGHFNGALHVLTDEEAKWNEEDFKMIILPARKRDANFPIFARGNYNWNDRKDYAAIVTNDSNSLRRIVIILDSTEVIYLKLDLTGAGIETYKTRDIENIMGNQIRLKGDGILVQWFESSSYILYWSGQEFLKEWTGD